MITIKPGDINIPGNVSAIKQNEPHLMEFIPKNNIANDRSHAVCSVAHNADNEWIFIGHLPKQSKLSFIFMLNNEDIIHICDDRIFKYILKQNTWSLIYRQFPVQFAINSVAFDANSKTNDFYVNILDNHIDRKFYQCKLYKDDALKIEALDIEHDPCEFIEHSIVINGEYHIFCLTNNDTQCLQHLILNQKTKTFCTSYNFPAAFTNFGLIYLKKQQRLLLFGGLSRCGMTQKGVTDIYSASLNESTQQWTWCKPSVRLPAATADVVCVATDDEQHVILLGGTQNISYEWTEYDDNVVEYKDMDCIYVLDVNTMDIKQSHINCPKRGVFNAVVPRSSSMEKQYLISGFIKTFDDEYAANDIIHLIESFYQNEYIHLLDRNGFEKMHCKISVDHILNSL